MKNLIFVLLIGCAGIPQAYQTEKTAWEREAGDYSPDFVSPGGIRVITGGLDVSPSEFAWIEFETKRNFDCQADLEGSYVLFQKENVKDPFELKGEFEGVSWRQILPPHAWNAIVVHKEPFCANSLSHELAHMLIVECFGGVLDGFSCYAESKDEKEKCERAISKRVVTCQN
jgi:hypothetical protein